MLYRSPDKIKRDYGKPFFSKRRGVPMGRVLVLAILLALIIAIPTVAFLQYDRLQFIVLDQIGYAPTTTPFASERAAQAQTLYASGEILRAEQLYRLAAQQQPDNIDYLYEYGKILIEAERSDEAVPFADKIIALAPNDPRGYALKANALMWNDPTTAIPAAFSGIERSAVPFAPLHGALAVAFTNVGRYQEALQRGDLAIRIDPMDANARRSYSYPLIFTGRYTEAIEQLEQAIAINPNIAAPYFELASLYRRINKPDVAVGIYRRVLEIDPDNPRAFLRICETYAAVGQFQIAEGFCDSALEIDPQYASAHRMLGQLRYSRRNYEGAIEEFETCLRLGSEEIECYYLRGLAHYFLGNCDTAWEILNESLARTDLEPILESINIGLFNVTQRCAGYQGRSLPTAVPPTPIPPTPIGGGA